MTESADPEGHGAEPSAIEVVPRAVADEIIADALATIGALERELDEVHQATTADTERVDAATQFLIQQSETLVTEAQMYRAKVIEAARAEVATILDANPAPANGQR